MFLEIENLRVSYEKIKALQGIDFQVDRGEIVCMIGANGAGEKHDPSGHFTAGSSGTRHKNGLQREGPS